MKMTISDIAAFYGVSYAEAYTVACQRPDKKRSKGQKFEAEDFREPLLNMYLEKALNLREKLKKVEETAKGIRDADYIEVEE